MTGRAIIWCGHLKRNNALDPVAFRNDIEMAHRAALRRGVAPGDIWALVCDDSLLPDDFSGKLYPPDMDSLDRVTRDLATVATPQDGLLFIATNHCEPDGLLTALDPPDEFADQDPDPAYVTPDFLHARLDGIAGQQVVLMATCHAGIFLTLGNHERRLVLTSCESGPDYTHTETHPPRSMFLYEILSHWAGISLANYQAPRACSLSEAVAQACESCPRGRFEGHASWPFAVIEVR